MSFSEYYHTYTDEQKIKIQEELKSCISQIALNIDQDICNKIISKYEDLSEIEKVELQKEINNNLNKNYSNIDFEKFKTKSSINEYDYSSNIIPVIEKDNNKIKIEDLS